MLNSSIKGITAVVVLAMLAASGCATDTPPAGTDVYQVDPVEKDASSAEDTGSNQGSPDIASDVGGNDEDAATPVPDAGSDAAGSGDVEDAGHDGGDVSATPDAVSDASTDPGSGLEGDTCDVAVDVTAGGVWEDQTTKGYTDNYEARAQATNCPNNRFSGPDRTYYVAPTETTAYRVQVDPTTASFDPAIYVRTSCDEDACVAGTVLHGVGVQESLTFTAEAGQTLYIIVDGEVMSDGDYTLTVELL